jgi:hypothetical protein
MSGSLRVGSLVLWLGAALVATCYRARVDLKESAPAASSGGGASGDEGTSGAAGGLAGAPDLMTPVGGATDGAGGVTAGGDGALGGAGSDGVGTANSGAGGGASLPCEGSLEPLQEDCAQFGLPLPATCHETTLMGWDGCIAGGCNVCVEQLADYPHYFDWHPCCQPNTTCGKQAPLPCNERCPAPTEHDKTPRCFDSER